MILVTGDTHGSHDTAKLFDRYFPLGKKLTRDDKLIICGDFGCLFKGGQYDAMNLRFFEDQPYTTLWVDGNHENFDTLSKYEVVEWHGGKVQFIKDNIIHLMRGQVYNIDGNKIFTFGGGTSIDKIHRIEGLSWWPQELPSYAEIEEALSNLENHNNSVDYVITHAAPETIMRNELRSIKRMYGIDCPTEKFLNEMYMKIEFVYWYCGHYHMDVNLEKCKLYELYNHVVSLGDNKRVNKGLWSLPAW